MNLIKKLSPAKINLALQILSKRNDGYHNINTIFFRIPFFDELIFEEAENINVVCNPDLSIPLEDNIVFKAINLIKQKFNINRNLRVILNKNIPKGGGLGGGSSNAAMTLLFLNDYWGLKLKPSELNEIGLELGSDVPFFLTDYDVAIGKGRGEILKKLDYKFFGYLVLVLPNIHISTKEAYSNIDLKSSIIEQPFDEILKTDRPIKEILFNDFEKKIFQKYPVLNRIKDLMYEQKAVYAGMSGSGSTMFGLFNELNNAQSAITSLDILKKIETNLFLETHLLKIG
ncbi:MAG: 4-(cytidine 5'-diphospho)-2-C-methyl-D-erythritol kinase [Candidatus Kapabacteria bacterium]|nr:4-(cytidine 5'-diphospho)-2-C-methyl-D-erythritol kinase [Candidatus Kapabacteria bacterium]